jgi:hypothetical protein
MKQLDLFINPGSGNPILFLDNYLYQHIYDDWYYMTLPNLSFNFRNYNIDNTVTVIYSCYSNTKKLGIFDFNNKIDILIALYECINSFHPDSFTKELELKALNDKFSKYLMFI